MAYFQIEPFGQTRADLQAGVVASTLVNIWSKKGARRSVPSDFLLQFASVVDDTDIGEEAVSEDWDTADAPIPMGDESRPGKTWQQQLALVEILNRAFGGKDLRGHTDVADGQAGSG